MESNTIIGQRHIEKHFENAIKMGKISHAYIINGESGMGKKQLAVNFAKALQCAENAPESSHRTGKACGHCKSCHQTDSKNQPDIKFITHEKAGIGVDEIREQLNDDIVIKPYSSRYKIYIIDESEKMTAQAQNALLKTIEEPPEYAIIMLLTTNADIFLQTILSRCVLLNMRPAKEEQLRQRLMSEYGIGSYEAGVAAAFSGGNYGKAIKLAASDDFKEMKNSMISVLLNLKGGGMDTVSTAIKKTEEFKKQIGDYFDLMRMWFGDILVYKSLKSHERLMFQDEYLLIEEMESYISFRDTDIILKAIDRTEKRIQANVNFDTSMEVLLLAIKERMRK